ncbi:hypothetical protein [Elizabethkingia anophelis]|uniref:hypothetical protein n=1 Tax=Elizabethkingia anophelis TaxID=1117645 RepID=UPI001EE76194|nr:hypothetical protein [Elizabethkingia anophelis]UKY84824.1 hypothetical protein KUF66_09340 [Elizabethkingia anophelis]UKY95444.1 hypothetical protein KUF67_09280 [Elizabethkingia anophelis]
MKMKKMNTYLTIILILLFNNVYSQIPIGKNINGYYGSICASKNGINVPAKTV